MILFEKFDYSFQQLALSLPDKHLNLIRPLDDQQLPWPGIIMGVSVLGFWYWVTNQYITQRVLGAKNIAHAQWGAIFGSLLKIIPLFTMVLPGVMAYSLFPNLHNADMVFPILVTEVLPPGITGLVLAGLIAAIMSSVDSTLNSASTLVVHDFIKPHKTDLSPDKLGIYGRMTTLCFMCFAVLWAPIIANMGGLWVYIQQAFSVLVPPIAAIFVMGVFWRRGNAQGALYTLILGHIMGVILFVLAQLQWWLLHFTLTVGLMTLLSAAIFMAVSLMTTPPTAETVNLCTWQARLSKPTEPIPWYLDYRMHSVGVVLVMMSVLIVFW